MDRKIDKKVLLLQQLQVFLDVRYLTGEMIISHCDATGLHSFENSLQPAKNNEYHRKLRLIGQIRKKIILNNVVHTDGKEWLSMNEFQLINWDYFDGEKSHETLKRKFNFETNTINVTENGKRARKNTPSKKKINDIVHEDCKMDTTFFESFVLDSSVENEEESNEQETICISDSESEQTYALGMNYNVKSKKASFNDEAPAGKVSTGCQTVGKYTTIASNADQIIQELVQIIKTQNENHQDALHKILTHTSIGLEAVKKFMHYGILQVKPEKALKYSANQIAF